MSLRYISLFNRNTLVLPTITHASYRARSEIEVVGESLEYHRDQKYNFSSSKLEVLSLAGLPNDSVTVSGLQHEQCFRRQMLLSKEGIWVVKRLKFILEALITMKTLLGDILKFECFITFK